MKRKIDMIAAPALKIIAKMSAKYNHAYRAGMQSPRKQKILKMMDEGYRP